MANLVNHLKDRDAQRKTIAVAAGRHVVSGHPAYTYTTGAAPNHNIFLRQVLGMGDWEGPEGVFYSGLVIPPADYIFHSGSQPATGAFFPTDSPHTGIALIDVKIPVGVGDADTSKNVPTDFTGIFKCEKFPDFDASGNQINSAGTIVATPNQPLVVPAFFYTPNPARVVVGWMFKYGNIKRSRINWVKWTAWRDYCAGLETVDYRTLPDFDGFGLTGSYYNGTNFETLLVRRTDASTFFAPSAGSPAAGVNPDNFSVRWQGFIKANTTETYTFKCVHTNGARITVGGTTLIDQYAADGSIASGTQTGTKALTAGEYYPIEILWNHSTGSADFSLQWSAPSVPLEIIPPEAMYPAVEQKPRYEAHVAFSTPATCDQMIETVLFVSNSIRQDIGGLIEFSCSEQMTAASFHFDDRLPENRRVFIPGSLSLSRSDVRISELRNVWEAKFRDLDSQYLQEPTSPLSIKIPLLVAAAGREITGEPIDLLNMTRWQARKVLERFVNLVVLRDAAAEFEATARSFPVVAGDVVSFTHEMAGVVAAAYQCVESTDFSPEETADTRRFKLKEWSGGAVAPLIEEAVAPVGAVGAPVTFNGEIVTFGGETVTF